MGEKIEATQNEKYDKNQEKAQSENYENKENLKITNKPKLIQLPFGPIDPSNIVQIE